MLMKELAVEFFRHRFVRFVFAGGTSVVLNLTTRAIFSVFLSYEIAIILAYLVGMGVAWLLMRIMVFETTAQRVKGEIIRFVIVNMFGLCQVEIISILLLGKIDAFVGNIKIAETLAHLIGLTSLIFTSYFLHSRFTYSSALPKKNNR